MDYLTWNDKIGSNFFHAEMAGRRVRLFVTKELINELGSSEGVNVPDFVEAAKVGPPWATRPGLCQKALQSLRNWRERGRFYPPYTYIGYLALFVLAAGIDGDFAPHAYYPRLRNLLGEEPTSGQYPSFDQMLELWDDLERWSNRDRGGELGFFTVDIAGNWIHVGLPLAQTLLTEQERDALPTIFASAGLNPASPPSDQVLATLLTEYGKQKLRPRTLRLLCSTSSSDEELLTVLTEIIFEELLSWDGAATDTLRSTEHSALIYSTLSLCCELDTTAGCANMTFRCRSTRDFPDDGFLLSLDGYTGRLSCEEAALGWSSPICSETSGQAIDASAFDWSKDIRMKDQDQGWVFSLAPSPVRIFEQGAIYGLPGLVETRRLPKGSPFYLAVQKGHHTLLEQWGTSVIEDWFGPFEGWTNGQRWNGWECPYCEFDTAIQMVDTWNNVSFGEEEYKGRYDEERDAFYFRDGGLEEWDCFTAQTIEIEGKTIKVYPIGAFCWIWNKADGL